MADKTRTGGKPDKQARVDKAPEALARAEKAQAGQGQGCAPRRRLPREKKPREPRGARDAAAAHAVRRRRSARSSTEQFGYKNRMQVPMLQKIVLNMGIGEGVNDRKKVEQAAEATGG